MEHSKLRRRKTQYTEGGPCTSADVNFISVQSEVNPSEGNVSDQVDVQEHSENSTTNEPSIDGNFFGAAAQPIVLVDDTKIEDLRLELRGN